MDQGHERSRIPAQGTLARECHSCAIAQLVPDRGTGNWDPYVVEGMDEDVVVLSGPDFDGLIVVPRQHVGTLEELPLSLRAHVLAALRRVTQSVRQKCPGEARVVVLTDPPASADHVCFQVIPNGTQDPVSSAPRHM